MISTCTFLYSLLHFDFFSINRCVGKSRALPLPKKSAFFYFMPKNPSLVQLAPSARRLSYVAKGCSALRNHFMYKIYVMRYIPADSQTLLQMNCAKCTRTTEVFLPQHVEFNEVWLWSLVWLNLYGCEAVRVPHNLKNNPRHKKTHIYCLFLSWCQTA